MRAIVPVKNLSRRLPELGKLKFGDTQAKGGRRTLDKWRVVSNHVDCLDDIARLYGGTPKPYEHKKSTFTHDLHTDSDVLAIGVPNMGVEPVTVGYEMWTGGGCERRCDGVTATTWGRGPDGPEEREQPCICDAKQAMECKVKLRASFFLPGVRRFGTWRLETGSWNAVSEMAGMVEMLMALQARGIAEAELALAKRSDVKAGQTRHYVVPEIRVRESVEELMAGAGLLGTSSLTAPPPAAELVAGPVAGEGVDALEVPVRGNEPATDEFPPGWQDRHKAKTLTAARRIAKANGLPEPTAFAEIDADLACAVVASDG